jgi:hypothetical protein
VRGVPVGVEPVATGVSTKGEVVMAILWVWRHGSLDGRDVDDNEYVKQFWYADQSDDCAVDGVEVGGVFIDDQQIRESDEYKALERADTETWRRQFDSIRHNPLIDVRHPVSGDWACWDSVSPDQVDSTVAELVDRWGADRGRVRARY